MIYLASASPRRKVLLEQEGYDIQIIKSNYVETNTPGQNPYYMVMEQALGKAKETNNEYCANDFVIGADTIVVLDGVCLGKPKDEEEAFFMLKSLCGKTHEVVTGVAILKEDMQDVFYVVTKIEFNKITDEEIMKYIKTGSPMDKAGAYGLQDLDEVWIKQVQGSKTNVIGLPIDEVKARLALWIDD